MARHETILTTIGRTPVVRLRRLAPPGIDLWAKVEAFNPLGSVKDRLALGVIEDAERRGLLKPGGTVVEATSGNTGIGLAMVCAAKGYPLVVVMPESFSVERRKILRFLGAKVVLTPASLRGMGMLRKARELAEAHGWYLCRQFENEANAEVHARTTAREILEDFPGGELDFWVTGFGTGGTLQGVARVLKKESPRTRVVVCEPDNSPVLSGGIRQPRNPDGSPSEGHPSFRTHLVQGWSPDFVPKLVEDASTMGLIDAIVAVDSGEAVRLSRELARKEGIFAGISAGATLAGALRVARSAPAGSRILCMLPDTAERYLSTPLFEGIAEGMTAEEEAIAASTPGGRVESASPVPAAAPSPEDRAFVRETIGANPVLIFSLRWCEFCASVRNLLDRCGVPYRSIDLDAPEMREGDRGGRIRAALQSRTGSGTVPQVFVGGECVGGCSETFEAFRSGRLGAMLEAAGVPFEPPPGLDPATLLPNWLRRTT